MDYGLYMVLLLFWWFINVLFGCLRSFKSLQMFQHAGCWWLFHYYWTYWRFWLIQNYMSFLDMLHLLLLTHELLLSWWRSNPVISSTNILVLSSILIISCHLNHLTSIWLLLKEVPSIILLTSATRIIDWWGSIPYLIYLGRFTKVLLSIILCSLISGSFLGSHISIITLWLWLI